MRQLSFLPNIFCNLYGNNALLSNTRDDDGISSCNHFKFFFKELTRVTIGQFAQDAKCIDHRALIIVVYVSDASEEWTIIVHGKNKDIMFCTIITHQGVWTLDILHYYYEK